MRDIDILNLSNGVRQIVRFKETVQLITDQIQLHQHHILHVHISIIDLIELQIPC